MENYKKIMLLCVLALGQTMPLLAPGGLGWLFGSQEGPVGDPDDSMSYYCDPELPGSGLPQEDGWIARNIKISDKAAEERLKQADKVAEERLKQADKVAEERLKQADKVVEERLKQVDKVLKERLKCVDDILAPAKYGDGAPALPDGFMTVAHLTDDPADVKVPVTVIAAQMNGVVKAQLKAVDKVLEERLKEVDSMICKYAKYTAGAIVVGSVAYIAYKYIAREIAFKAAALKNIVIIKKAVAKAYHDEASNILGLSGMAQVSVLRTLLVAKKTGVFGVSNVVGHNKALIQALSVDRDIACISGKFVANCFENPKLHEKLTEVLRLLEWRKMPLVILGAESVENNKAFFEWLSIAFPKNVVILSFKGSDSVCSQDTGRSFDLNAVVEA